MGASAWADTASTIYTKALSDWASTDVTTTEGEVSKWYNATGVTDGNSTGMKIDAEKGLGVCASRTTATAELTLNRTPYSIITLDAVWNVGSSSANAMTPHTYFTYGGLNITQTVDTRSVGTTCTINGNAVTLSNTFPVDAEMIIHLVVNSYTGAITEFYIKNGETTVADYSGLTSDNNSFPAATNYDAVILKAVAGATSGSQQTKTYIKSITVKEETQSVYSYMLNAVNSSSQVLKTLATGTCMTGSSVSLDYPSHININGTLYTTTALSDGSKQYRVTFTPDADAYTKTITYTSSATTDVVYLVEAEEISGASKCTNGGNSTRCSGGATAYMSNAKLITLPKGSYKATVYNYNSSSTSRTVTINDGSDNVYSQSHGNGRTNASQEFVLSETKTLYITGGHRSSGVVDDGIDLVYITGSTANETVGALDFSTGYFGDFNDNPVWINAGETGYYKFVNHNNAGASYSNWELFAATEASVNLTILRADNWVNLGGGTINSFPTTSDIVSDLANATVELTVNLADAGDNTYTLTSTAHITKADGTEMSPDYVYTQTGFTVSKLKLYVSAEGSWLELLKEAVKKNITSAGYATYYSNNALDFANATPAGLTASLITGASGTTLTTSDVNNVPAETAVLLAGDENTYTIPVIASSSTSITGNKLEGVHVATEKDANSIYVLMASPSVGFYKNNKAFTVGANTAYLPSGFDTSGARAFYLFGDESTGINADQNVKVEGEYYNLSGQRVAAPQKGLYIVNGKKVVLK